MKNCQELKCSELRIVFQGFKYTSNKEQAKEQIMSDITDACIRQGAKPEFMSIYKLVPSAATLMGIATMKGDSWKVREDLIDVLAKRKVEERFYTIKTNRVRLPLLSMHGKEVMLEIGIKQETLKEEPMMVWTFRMYLERRLGYVNL